MVYFLQDWIVNPMLNLLKRTMAYSGFEPGTFGVAVTIPNHYTPFELSPLVEANHQIADAETSPSGNIQVKQNCSFITN
jgi:hypothetical protein